MQNRCVDYRLAHTKMNLQFYFRYTFWSILLFFVSDFCCRHHTAMCWEHSTVGVWREDHGLSLLALSFSFRLVQVFSCPSFFTLHSILCCIVRQTWQHELLLLSTNPEYSFHFFVFNFFGGGLLWNTNMQTCDPRFFLASRGPFLCSHHLPQSASGDRSEGQMKRKKQLRQSSVRESCVSFMRMLFCMLLYFLIIVMRCDCLLVTHNSSWGRSPR